MCKLFIVFLCLANTRILVQSNSIGSTSRRCLERKVIMNALQLFSPGAHIHFHIQYCFTENFSERMACLLVACILSCMHLPIERSCTRFHKVTSILVCSMCDLNVIIKKNLLADFFSLLLLVLVQSYEYTDIL